MVHILWCISNIKIKKPDTSDINHDLQVILIIFLE